MKRNKSYWNNIAGYLTGEMNKEQIEKFLLKIKDNQHLKNDVELMRNSWENAGANPEEKYSDTASAWQKLDSRIRNEGIDDIAAMKRPVFQMGHYIRIAAVILIILGVGIPAVYYSVKQGNIDQSVIEHHCTEGTMTLDLPDGSRVYLNEGAKLNYQDNYDSDRKVNLEGEGFFDVLSDPGRPFKVSSGKAIITVLGTSFNIRERASESVEVFVESGKVRVDLDDVSESVVLNPGELVKADHELNPSKLTDANYLSWKTKEFSFIDEPLTDIMNVLEKAYHVDLEFDSNELSGKRLTTTYKQQSFDAILNTICTAMDLNYEKNGKVYILQSK